MKNSDFIQMTQCHIFGVSFPTDNLEEVLNNATFETGSEYVQVEIVSNPMTKRKIHKLDQGLFFSMRITYRQITQPLLAAKIYELKNALKGQVYEESQWKALAEEQLVKAVPASNELVNVFYSPDKELLFTNKGSKYARLALNHLIKTFDLLGFRSIVVSDEKLGLNTRLEKYLNENQPLFQFLHFQCEATLRNVADNGDEAFLTCRHLDTQEGIAKAKEALTNGFKVQSLQMRLEDHFLNVNFKLDSRLRVRSMRFSEVAEVSRQLNSHKFAGKALALDEYLNAQLEALLQIAKSTVLEFVAETKLESFI